jgi:hypothetical protein
MPSQAISSWARRVTNIVQEGKEKVVDFADDEPYTVEGLSIHLYTFGYPTRTWRLFDEPAIEELTPTSGEPGSTSIAVKAPHVGERLRTLQAQEPGT